MKQNWVNFCQPPNQTRTSRLQYIHDFLKKVHKNPMGIQPIVSSGNNITESSHNSQINGSKTISISSYHKDSIQFINLIKSQTLPYNCFLASIDVSTLYTNVPHSEGMQSVLQMHIGRQSNLAIPIDLSELVNIIVLKMYLEFNNRYYQYLYKSKVPLRVLKWHQLMQNSLWEIE